MRRELILTMIRYLLLSQNVGAENNCAYVVLMECIMVSTGNEINNFMLLVCLDRMGQT